MLPVKVAALIPDGPGHAPPYLCVRPKVRKLALVFAVILSLYLIGFIGYIHSSNFTLLSSDDNEKGDGQIYLVRDWPRSSLCLYIIYGPTLQLWHHVSNNHYIQGGQWKVRKSYWDNFSVLFTGKPDWWY